jgi:hypothetical protein
MDNVRRPVVGFVTAAMRVGLPAIGLAVALVLWSGQVEASKAFNVNCGADGVMVGISGRQGWWMDQITPQCRTINSDGTLSSALRSGGSAGGNGGTAKGPFTCPQGHVVVGITGSASTSGTRRVLYVHELRCFPWAPETRTPVASGPQIFRAAFPRTNPIGIKGNSLMQDCPTHLGQVATGLSGWADTYIDGIRDLGCRLAPGATPPPKGSASRPPPKPATSSPAPVAAPQPASTAPDLQPAWSGTLLRQIAPVRHLQDSFCSGLSRQPTNQTAKMYLTVPAVRWGVTNSGSADVIEPFEVKLESLVSGGPIVLRIEYLAGLPAGQTRYFTYQRPQSRTVVARLGTTLTPQEQSTYRASGGECVQEMPQPESQYEWQDPGYRVTVDEDGAITNDANRGNNSRTY